MKIELKEIEKLEKKYVKNEKLTVLRHALSTHPLNDVVHNEMADRDNQNIFSLDLETMPVTNQLQSGRCWIFSALNVLREVAAKKYNVEELEFSQNYVAFYDKLEKANWFMTCAIQEIGGGLDSEKMRFLLKEVVSDGGQWNMLVSLIRKYGIVIKSAMPETYQSSHTNSNVLLNRRLRRFVLDIQGKKEAEIVKLHKEALEEIYGLLASCFGVPPKSFTWEYRDKDKNFHRLDHLDPVKFYEDLGVALEEYIYVINGPTADKKFYQTYSVDLLGNVVDGEAICMLNLPMDELKSAVISQMKEGMPTWFGCDCSQFANRTTGAWDDQQYAYASSFDMKLEMSKAELLDSHESMMNHAMVLTGVNLVNDQPTRWKIENSWGDKIAHKGYFIASDTWFDQYVYVAAVHKKHLSKKASKALKKSSKVLKPWDPFGTLAIMK